MTTTDQTRLDRRVFIAALLERIPDALVVSGLGSATYDLYAAGDRPENFYLWGAMAQPGRWDSAWRWPDPSAPWSR